MHIGIVGPIATTDIASNLDCDSSCLPKGYPGAPLLGSLIGELLLRGHTVSGYTLSNDMPLNANGAITACGKNFQIHYCPMRPRAWKRNDQLPGRIVDFYKFERRVLEKTIFSTHPEVVHAHWAYEFASAALATGLPHVITCHDSPFAIARLNSFRKPTISMYRWLRAFMSKEVLQTASIVSAVSPYMRDQVQDITKARIEVIPNPVDNFALSFAKIRQVSTCPQIAMVCNGWDGRKNPQSGLIAFSKLLKKIPNAQLHLYGADFGLKQIAQKWCQEKNIKLGLHFHGALPHRQLLQELNKHDLLLHTSIEESFGMVIAEAMAMGLPVVAGESSGAVPWVVGVNGCLCDITDVSSIEKALLEALDIKRYSQLSQNGMEAVRQRFTTPAVVDLFFAQYELAIAQAASKNLMQGTQKVTS